MGAPHSAIFLLSVLFSLLGWYMFGRVEAPTPGDEGYKERQKVGLPVAVPAADFAGVGGWFVGGAIAVGSNNAADSRWYG